MMEQVITRCLDCLMFGIPMLEVGYAIRCGNCNSLNVRLYQEITMPTKVMAGPQPRGALCYCFQTNGLMTCAFPTCGGRDPLWLAGKLRMADPKVTEAEGD